MEGLRLGRTPEDDMAIASVYGPAQGQFVAMAELAEDLPRGGQGHARDRMHRGRHRSSREITIRRVPRIFKTRVRAAAFYVFGRYYAMRDGHQRAESLLDRHAEGYEERKAPRLIRWHRVIEGRQSVRQAVRVQETANESPESYCIHQ